MKQIHSTDSLALNQWMDWKNCLRQQFWKSPTLNLARTELAERDIQGQRALHWAQCRHVDLTTAQVKRSWESGKLFSKGYLVSCWRMQ